LAQRLPGRSGWIDPTRQIVGGCPAARLYGASFAQELRQIAQRRQTPAGYRRLAGERCVDDRKEILSHDRRQAARGEISR
jgi:hypothetical protein